MRIKKILIGFFVWVAFLLAGLLVNNYFVKNKYLIPLSDTNLSEKECQMVEDVQHIIRMADHLWAGFENAEIPIILYNDKFEFLVSDNIPDSNWTLIDSLSLCPHYISNVIAENPQSFGVKRNGKWMGSLATCQKMNKDILRRFTEELPPFISQLLPYNLFDITADYYVALFIHEAFHAFQGIKNEGKLKEALSVYAQENYYPYDNENNIAGWNEEGAILSKAMKEKDDNKLKELVRRWMDVRKQRRADGQLEPQDIDYEKRLEWLEGLAFYVEQKAYKAASEMGDMNFSYAKKPNYWKDEMNNLQNKLGHVERDLRFYLSGMAQAVILDKLKAEWQENIMQEGTSLEDIIFEMLN